MARRLSALALLALAAACGDTLVDHSATDLLQPPGGNVCEPALCADPDPLPSGAKRACLGPIGEQTCGYECEGGLLKCAAGCCPAAKVAAGKAHTCAIAGAPAAGELFCWGANESRQSAPAVISGVWAAPRQIPVSIAPVPVTAVALGDAHTCAVAAGAVRCWGANGSGQLTVPAGLSNVVALAVGTTFTCALDSGGAVTCWGGGMPAAPAVGGAASAIAAGADHACALVGGAVRCWGAGAVGQLGVEPPLAFAVEPVEALSGVAAVAAGSDLTCAAKTVSNGQAIDDALLCWGSGLGTPLLAADPALTPLIPMKRADQSVIRFDVATLAVGRTHVCVQREDPLIPQPVSCLGSEAGLGQLGGPTFGGEAIDVFGTDGTPSFALGADHGCAVTAAGGVTCWGDNASGQLGDGTQVTPGFTPGDLRALGTPVFVSGR
jgi:hypothetical protein